MHKELARKTNWRCRAFLRGDFRALFESLEPLSLRVRASASAGSAHKQAARAIRLARVGELRRSMQTLDALEPLEHDEAALAQLQRKFPTEPEAELAALLVDLPSELTSSLKTWEELVGEHDPIVGEGNHLRAFSFPKLVSSV